MSAAKHTPGPWEVVVTTDGITVPNWHIQIGEVKLPAFPYKRIYSEDRTQSGLVQDDELVADIHLIAAAPKLLEALKAADLAMSNKHFAAEVLAPDSVVREMMRAAIAKAEGGAE